MPDTADASLDCPAAHGARALPAVTVDSYNVELRRGSGFIGDRVSNRGFRAILESWRERLREIDEDPLGDKPSEEIGKRKLDKSLTHGEPEAAGVVQATINDFAGELAAVIKRFLALEAWRRTERILIGGGLRASRIGETALGLTSVLLKAEGVAVDLAPIRHHPDEAGLIGAVHLVPAALFKGYDAILAVDIGGSNIRAGIVELALGRSSDLAKAHIFKSELWRYRDEKPSREAAIERLVAMLEGLIDAAKGELDLAPFIGIGCPGLIGADGAIRRGGQNLPGNWEDRAFNLPRRLADAIPKVDGRPVRIVMHNDAVVQGLSEVPFMRDLAHWAILTIGTGLGNARFTNRRRSQ